MEIVFGDLLFGAINHSTSTDRQNSTLYYLGKVALGLSQILGEEKVG